MLTGCGIRLEREAIDPWNSTVIRPWLTPAYRSNSPLIQRRAAPMPRSSLVVSERVWRGLNPTSRSPGARGVSAEISETIRSTFGFLPGGCPGGCASASGGVIARVNRRTVLKRVMDIVGAGHAPPAARGSLKSQRGFLRKNLFVVRFVLVDDLFRFECFDRSAAACRGEDFISGLVRQEFDRILSHAFNIPDFGNVTGLAMDDEFGETADARSDHREFARHRLKCGEAETLRLASHK